MKHENNKNIAKYESFTMTLLKPGQTLGTTTIDEKEIDKIIIVEKETPNGGNGVITLFNHRAFSAKIDWKNTESNNVIHCHNHNEPSHMDYQVSGCVDNLEIAFKVDKIILLNTKVIPRYQKYLLKLWGYLE